MLVIKDVPESKQLDLAAMKRLRGGWGTGYYYMTYTKQKNSSDPLLVDSGTSDSAKDIDWSGLVYSTQDNSDGGLTVWITTCQLSADRLMKRRLTDSGFN